MINKTVFVTGATSGIGLALARRLAETGHRVLLGARTPASGERAAALVRESVPAAELAVVAADLSDLSAVRALASQANRLAPQLDGLVLNAAEVRTTRRPTLQGLDTNLATNYLSGFLLSALLLPELRAGAGGRIVTVSSSNHAHVKRIDLAGLATMEGLGHAGGYSTTKLLNVLHATALAPLLAPSGVTINVADPGFVRTDLGRHATGGFALFLKLARPFQSTPERAAQTPYYLATAPEVGSVNGGYFSKCRPGTPSALSQDRRRATELREWTVDLLSSRDIATRAELTP